MTVITLKKLLPIVLLPLFFCFWLLWKKPPHQEVHSTTRVAMGTLVTVSTWGVRGPEEERAIARVFGSISEMESLAGRLAKSSPVYKINHAKPGTLLEIPEELATILETGLEMRKSSHGAFDPGLASLLDLWGFSNGVPDIGKVPEAQSIHAWIEERKKNPEYGVHLNKTRDGSRTIQLDGPAFALDLGAIAKGYALDRAMETMKRSGIENALIIGGGDMIMAGSKGGQPWRIGIQHPRDHDKIMAFAEITGEMAMATSGDYERFFMAEGERQHHILDPQTGRPSRSGLISVSIQTKKSMMADALSTAVFVLGMEKGKELIGKLEGVEGMLVKENGERWMSPGFKGQWLEGS
ncbi:MAG: FAD:protein FMN transferase [Magnetococcales bacterium]|nr:FAD:protein FMN transferase [Magnetococcales bacterium]